MKPGLMVLLLVGFSFSLPAQQNADEQAEVENRLLQLKTDISALQQRLEDAREVQNTEQERLKQIDLSIQDVALKLRELEQQSAVHLQELAKLESQRDEYLATLEEKQGLLADQIRSTYLLASQSRVKLVLNQDNPDKLIRMLAYYDHINRAQAEKIQSLRKLLAELGRVLQLIDQELFRINTIQQEQNQTLEQHQQQRGEREILLATLAAKIDNEETALLELVQDRKDLEELLQKLSDVLSDIPANLGQHLGIAEQRGQLPVPVSGRVSHGFGQKRSAGVRWQGWMFDVISGTEVSNIAYGRVAFSDWLRGYGLLMIIDHGQGFMSLYGYNESLLWEVGDWVEPAAVIATVGGSPSGEQGLYFEMRKEGKAIDPANWIKR